MKNLQSGDILFWGMGVEERGSKHSRINDFYKWLIKISTKSQFTHTGVLVNINGIYYVYEAVLSGVRKRKLVDGEQFFVVSVDKTITKEGILYLDSLVGSKYSKVEAALSVFKVYLPNNKLWYCSELVHSYLNKFVYKNLSELKTPTKVLSMLLKRGLSLRLIKF